MSVIQNIRSKYIGLVVGAIVVALIGFLIMDAMQSNTRGLMGDDQTLMADVNGNRIDYKKFEEKRALYEENMTRNSKDGKLTEQDRKQVREQAYNDMVNEILFNEEMEKLGLSLTDPELRDMETNPVFVDPQIRQAFTDPKTGVFDPNSVSQHISSFPQDKTGEKRKQWQRFEEELINNKLRSKYTDLIVKGVYVPKFVYEQDKLTKTTIASVSYLEVPYASIMDSVIKVTDEDIKKYMEKMPNVFKAREDMAKAEYVVFDIIPSSEDSSKSLGVLNTIRAAFDSTKDMESFVANNSDEALNPKYLTEDKIEMPNPAEVIAAPTGTILGPQFMNGSFKMVKVLDKKQQPDSVKTSHILIKVDEKRSDDVAKKMADSLEAAIKGGASLEMLAATVSDDEGSKAKGGDLGWISMETSFVPEFLDAAFSTDKGGIKIAKSSYGYHIIKVVDQKSFRPAVKLAIVSKLLQTGTASSNKVYAQANEFLKKAKDAKSFTEAAKAMGKDKRMAENLTKIQAEIPGLGEARQITRWAFEAKIGAVSPIYNLTDKCVIALLSGRTSKGEFPAPADVRNQLESMVKRDKKSDLISEKYKGKNSLEALATASGMQIKNLDSVRVNGGNELGYENRVLGAILNKSNLNKFVGPITGEQGVFYVVVRSNAVDAARASLPMDLERQQLLQQLTGQMQGAIPYILKMKADIKDQRSNFF
ncbi:MAG: peptidylprolyl isomerase [Chitinophagaceae bacterium]|nr:peptidylprolyl isomerase [Chitinophagaceae bacterium]